MSVHFLDSSALVKRYVAETGSAWIAGLLHPSAGNQIHAARISGVEVVAAIVRRARAGGMTPQASAAAIAHFRSDFENLPRIVEISPKLVDRAMDLAERHALRGYDAIQLGAALAVNDGCRATGLSLTFVCADDELNVAAAAEGLAVEDPNRHP